MAHLGFDATTVEPAQPFDVIPAGKYVCQITNSEMRPTKGGDGQYLWLELAILEGEFANRRLFDRLNIVNSNQQAVDIARRQLSALTGACGKTYIDDSEELHLIPITVTVRVRAAVKDEAGNPKYDASNEIRGYEPLNGAAPRPAPATRTAAAAPTTVAPAAKRAAAGGATPPWRSAR